MEIILKYFSDFTEIKLKQFSSLENLYRVWNERVNIISRKDIDNLYEKHVLHSLSIAAAFEFEAGNRIIDIGTGGGFPGIPLAIFFPEVQFHLVDSIAKKLKIVEAVVSELGLKNISIQNIRAEEINNTSKKKDFEKFDYAITRAVAPLKDLWRWSIPLLKRKSVNHNKESALLSTHNSELHSQTSGLICLKGGDLAKEIQESGTKPTVIDISTIFSEDYFREKYILFVPG